ncbi:MAG: hypothetical protein V1682_04335 [Candidatus Omnitrophota bacterium]
MTNAGIFIVLFMIAMAACAGADDSATATTKKKYMSGFEVDYSKSSAQKGEGQVTTVISPTTSTKRTYINTFETDYSKPASSTTASSTPPPAPQAAPAPSAPLPVTRKLLVSSGSSDSNSGLDLATTIPSDPGQ